MASTRTKYDEVHTAQSALDISNIQAYTYNVPGPGSFVPYHDDPFLRLQKWGGNMRTNTFDIDSDLKGLTRKINKSHMDSQNYKDFAALSQPVVFPTELSWVQQPRTSEPAWELREHSNFRWEKPFISPQHAIGAYHSGSFGLERPFQENICTRMIERDRPVSRVPPPFFNVSDYLPSEPVNSVASVEDGRVAK
jgi:hypothetical protein